MENSIQLWDDQTKVEEIKKLFAPDLTPIEFSIFVGIGKATGLNPYLREMWGVKYGKSPASIFIGRDGYRKSAQRSPDYDYHISDAIYSNDQFEVEDGIPRHVYNIKNDRGKIVGAYCVVKRKSSSKPNFAFVELKEYYSGNKGTDGKVKIKSYDGKSYPMKETLWDTKPATMIKKVAEAQCLRMTFQELFAGTYDESEQWEEPAAQKPNVQVVGQKKTVSNVKVVNKKITTGQEQEIYELFIKTIKNEDPDVQQKTATEALKKVYKVDSVSKLTFQQANDLISKLQVRLANQEKAVPEAGGKEVREDEAVEVLKKTFPGSTVIDMENPEQQKNEGK